MFFLSAWQCYKDVGKSLKLKIIHCLKFSTDLNGIKVFAFFFLFKQMNYKLMQNYVENKEMPLVKKNFSFFSFVIFVVVVVTG